MFKKTPTGGRAREDKGVNYHTPCLKYYFKELEIIERQKWLISKTKNLFIKLKNSSPFVLLFITKTYQPVFKLGLAKNGKPAIIVAIFNPLWVYFVYPLHSEKKQK